MTDRRSLFLLWCILFNARFAVKHPFFAPILAVCQARAFTNPIRQWSSSCYFAYHWLIGLLIARAWHTAKIGAKSLIGQKKTFSIIAHLCSEMAVFGRKSVLFLLPGLIDRFDTQWTKNAFQFYFRNRTTAQIEYVMGCTVNNLTKLWVCKLSCLKRHPSIQKSKILKYRALLQWKKKNLLPAGTPRLIDRPYTERRIIQMKD
jgi:hypothetical protein